MKLSRNRLLSLLLISLLLVSLTGLSAFAEGRPIQVQDWATLSMNINIIQEEDPFADDLGEPGADGEALECTVRKVTTVGGMEQSESLSLPVAMASLLNPSVEISIMPPDGYYISELSFGSPFPFPSRAQRNSTEVRICLWDLVTKDQTGFDSDYISYNDSGNYVLSVTCSKIDPYAQASVRFTGDLGYGYVVGYESVTPVPAPADELLSYAASQGYEFEGYKLTFDENGASMDVFPGDYVSLYSDATVEAQWKQGAVPAPAPVEPDTVVVPDGGEEPAYTVTPPEEPKTVYDVPYVTITAASDSKVYDGYALENPGYSVDGNMNGFRFDAVNVVGSITNPGSVANVINSFILYAPDNSVVPEDAWRGRITVENGTLTVTGLPLTVTAITAEVSIEPGETVRAADLSVGGFTNGYAVSGLPDGVWLEGNFVSGEGSSSFDTEILKDRISVHNAYGDVTGFFEISTVPGRVTVNVQEPQPTYDLTVTAQSMSWVYDGSEHTYAFADATGLVDGDVLEACGFTPESVITNPGTVSNRIDPSTVVITNNGQPVRAGKYRIETVDGTLTVTGLPITVTAVTAEVTIEPIETVRAADLTVGEFTNGYAVSGLPDGVWLEGNFVTGEGSSSFDTDILKDQIVVRNSAGDVTGFFEITTVPGRVTVNVKSPEPTYDLTITAQSMSWVYDGSEHKYESADATGLVDGDVLEACGFTPESVITNPGTVSNRVDPSTVVITNGGKPVRDGKYRIETVDGTLTVTGLPITVTAVTAEVSIAPGESVRAADLTIGEFTDGYAVSGLPDGVWLEGSFVSGEGSSSFDTEILKDQIVVRNSGGDITGFFEITTVPGRVTVKEKTPEPTYDLTITAQSQSWDYDGNEHSHPFADVTGLVDGDTVSDYGFTADSVITEPGTVSNRIDPSAVVITNNGQPVRDGKYNIQSVSGTLTVNQIPLTVTAVTAELTIHEGEQLRAADLTVGDYTHGYAVEGLPAGFRLEGNFVIGGGSGSFETNIQKNLIRVMLDTRDVTSWFDITTQGGYVTVTVIPTPAQTYILTIRAQSHEWVYDGEEHSWTKADVTGLVDGDVIENYGFKASSVITNPGSVYNEIDIGAVVITNNGQPVPAGKYSISTSSGTLTVSKRPLTVTAISGSLNTTGQEIIAAELDSQDGSFKKGYRAEGLLDSHELVGNFVIGRGTESFDTTIDLNQLRVKYKNSDWNVDNFRDLYNIRTVPGRIVITATVTPPPSVPPTPSGATNVPLVINPKSYTWIYDGEPHQYREYEVQGLIDGDRVTSVTFSSSSVITNVGEIPNQIVAVTIKSAAGLDVPQNKYSVTSTPATLYVTKRDLTVTAISGSITNTSGAELIAANLSSPDGTYRSGYKADGLVYGHQLMGNFVTGRGTTTFNTGIDLTQLRIYSGNVDVTANYNIRTVGGQITVNRPQQAAAIPVTVTAKSNKWVYDGNPHAENGFTVTGLVDGDTIKNITFKPASTITNVGTQSNEIESVTIVSANGTGVASNKYTINYWPGSLTVTKYPLTVTASSDSKVYDGKALNNKSVSVGKLANDNHSISAEYEIYDTFGNTIKNGPVDVGVYRKRVTSVVIKDKSGTDVTANYEIQTVEGTLTITAPNGSTNPVITGTAYYGSPYTIRSDAPYSEFQYLMIDGQRVPNDSYTVREGSTVITLKASYIQNLKTGSHNYTIVSTSRSVDGRFDVAKAPKTGDSSNTVLWIVLLVAAALAVAAALFFLKRGPGLPFGGKGKKKQHDPIYDAEFEEESEDEEVPADEDDTFTPSSILGEDPEEDADVDPTMDLMKDFEINLDDFRDEHRPKH